MRIAQIENNTNPSSQPEMYCAIKYPKIPRLENEKYIFTEKIDGTNGCIIITEHGDMFAQNRTRILSEWEDNFDFCKWVNGNRDELMKLGPGYHYGEWWGYKIQRHYDLKERRFSLFNTWHLDVPECVYKVPIVGAADWKQACSRLKLLGSLAAPGFDNPEGIVMQSKSYGKVRYKIIFDKKPLDRECEFYRETVRLRMEKEYPESSPMAPEKRWEQASSANEIFEKHGVKL